MEKEKFSSTIAGASIIITAGTLASKGLGFFREILFANYFGIGNEFDIYLVGAALPITLNTIIFFISQNYLIPNYYKKKENESSTAADDFVKVNVIIFFSLSLIFSFFLYLVSYNLVKGYLGNVSAETITIAQNIFNLFLVTIPIQTAFSVFANYLTARYDYKHPVISNIIVNVVVILSIIFGHGKIGIYSIVLGFILGNVLQLLYIIVFSKKYLSFNYINKVSLKKLESTFYLIIFIEAISQLFVLIDRYFYNQVQDGGIAAINYATTLYLLPLSIFSAGLATALFPKFSDSFSAKNIELLSSYLNQGLKNNLLIFIPITIFIFFNSELIVGIIYQRGKFSETSTLLTAEILKIFAISLIFYSSYAIINKFMYAAELLKKLVVLTFAATVTKLIINYLLVEKFMQNGLAVSSTISYSLMGVVGLYFSSKMINSAILWALFKHFVIFSASALISYLSAEMLFSVWQLLPVVKILLEPVVFGSLFFLVIVKLGFNNLSIIVYLSNLLKSVQRAL